MVQDIKYLQGSGVIVNVRSSDSGLFWRLSYILGRVRVIHRLLLTKLAAHVFFGIFLRGISYYIARNGIGAVTSYSHFSCLPTTPSSLMQHETQWSKPP